MGNQLSVRRSSANRFSQGDYSGNSGSNNITGSHNITATTNNYYNHGSGNTPENYSEILQQLYPPGSGYESHRNRVPEPVQGTCTWVMGHPKYTEWLGDKTSGLLWLSGDPGCGKSVIASFLVKQLETDTDAIICYFFFKDDSEEQKSATFALRAILHQLFVRRTSLCRYAEESFKAKGSRFTEEVDTLWSIFVKAIAEGGCGDVICVVDALDECSEETSTPLVRQIARLPQSQPSAIPLKFLVTSRPYHRIETELGSPATTIRLRGEEAVDAITADVTLVINAGIKRLESHWEQAGRLEYLRDLLQSSADRTFLWVSLVLESLKNSPDDSPEEFTNIVTSAPRDLAQFYTKILDKSPDPNKARRILHIVVAAARPLTLQEMNIAFRIRRDHATIKDIGDHSPGFGKTVKNWCGLFVRVIDGKIYLVHQTAREFLIQGAESGQGNWQYTLRPIDSSFIMADICVSYLSLEEFENDPLPAGPIRDTRIQEVGVYVRKHALLDYAAIHWPSHFRDCEDRQMELLELTRQICQCGSSRFLTWLRLYWNNGNRWGPAPGDFTHLMIASWLGQGRVVERLLEDGGDMNSRSEAYGTALDIAALKKDKEVAKILVGRNASAYLDRREYKILHTKRSELEVGEAALSDIVRKADQLEFWVVKAADLGLAVCYRVGSVKLINQCSGTRMAYL